MAIEEASKYRFEYIPGFFAQGSPDTDSEGYDYVRIPMLPNYIELVVDWVTDEAQFRPHRPGV